MVKVIPISTSVLIGDDIPARVSAVCVRKNGHITYECVWWNGRTHECQWLESFELKTDGGEFEELGFAVG